MQTDTTVTTLLHEKTLKALQDYAGLLPDDPLIMCAGVYGGGDIVAMAEIRTDAKFIAIDSWEGLADPCVLDSSTATKGKFAYPYKQFIKNTKGIDVDAYKMWISVPNLRKINLPKAVDMLWVDLDHALPTSAVLEAFMPFMADNGLVLVHDYGNPNYPGIKKVCDCFGDWRTDRNRLTLMQKKEH